MIYRENTEYFTPVFSCIFAENKLKSIKEYSEENICCDDLMGRGFKGKFHLSIHVGVGNFFILMLGSADPQVKYVEPKYRFNFVPI